MRFVDFFAGVGGIRLGLERAGHACVSSCEIDPFARAVYGERFGRAPEMEDIRAVKASDIPDADLWTGGFPCQDLSHAGRRAGINGERSGLVWRLLDLARARRPEFIFLENVRGLLTGTDGELEPDDEDVGETTEGLVSWLGVLLGALVELGYVGSVRVLDARYFGVPQRRRRAFILARHLGAGRRHPGRVLVERESLRGDRGQGRAPRADAAGAASDGARVGLGAREVATTISSRYGTRASPRGEVSDNLVAHALTRREGKGPDSGATSGNVIPYVVKSATSTDQETHARETDAAATVDRRGGYSPGQGGTVMVIPFDPTQLTHPENRSKCEPGAPAPSLAARARPPHIAYSITPEGGQGSDLRAVAVAPALTTPQRGAGMSERGTRIVTGDEIVGWRVRRLTPRECERLQGLPDDWTLIDGATPTQRYRVIGNSVAVPVIEWIGRRFHHA